MDADGCIRWFEDVKMGDRAERVGRLLVSRDLLCELLHLPEGSEILDARLEPNVVGGAIELTVRSPLLLEVQKGSVIPVVSLAVYENPARTEWWQ